VVAYEKNKLPKQKGGGTRTEKREPNLLINIRLQGGTTSKCLFAGSQMR